jgi:hypothetical protein
MDDDAAERLRFIDALRDLHQNGPPDGCGLMAFTTEIFDRRDNVIAPGRPWGSEWLINEPTYDVLQQAVNRPVWRTQVVSVYKKGTGVVAFAALAKEGAQALVRESATRRPYTPLHGSLGHFARF